MKNLDLKNNKTIRGTIAVLFLMAALIAFNWIVICGIVKLITLCFGWTFSWTIATGIWLVMILLRMVFAQSNSSKK